VMVKPATVGFFCNRTKQLMKILDGNGDKGRFESLIGQCRRSRWPICRRPSLKSECWFHLIMFSRFKIPHSDRPAGKRTQNGRDGRHAKWQFNLDRSYQPHGICAFPSNSRLSWYVVRLPRAGQSHETTAHIFRGKKNLDDWTPINPIFRM
jgi:hypothetical protein